MINYNAADSMFCLENSQVSYYFKVDQFGKLEHIYWGKYISKPNLTNIFPKVDRGFSTNYYLTEDRSLSYDYIPLELSTFGNGDFRRSSIEIYDEQGISIDDFIFIEYKIYSNKLKMNHLPHSRGEGQTLKIRMKDKYTDIYIDLFYHIFPDRHSIVRNIEVINKSNKDIYVEKINSMNLDIENDEYDLVYLQGSWAKERHISRSQISRGITILDSNRGISSHHMAPFYAICEKNSDNDKGVVYSFNLIYSGGFESVIEQDSINQLRLQMGMQHQGLNYKLKPNESLSSPEVVLTFSNSGLNGMMREHHLFVLNHILPKKYQEERRPILINNWEATYFDFNEEKIYSLAQEAKQLGIELFVLDDGWFGNRNSDTTSLGDWYVNTSKLPNGLGELSINIEDLDMKFGLWIEPEMISKESKLFKNNPEFRLAKPNREPSLSRSQYVLDLSNEEVINNISNQLFEILDNINISYIKWDMNRYLTDVYSQYSKKANVYHEYVLGFYKLAEKLTSRYPNILFEACAGGGGRFDWGVLFYFPQVWTSDNTDAIERLYIQDGSVLIFPQSTMGAHVSDVPNHQVNRVTPLKTRFEVAAPFNLGYELDLSKVKSSEKKQTLEEINWYKKNQEHILWGDFIRINSPFENNYVNWQINSKEGNHVYLFSYTILAETNRSPLKIKLKELDENAIYILEDQIFSGNELMYKGIYLKQEMNHDFKSSIMHFKKIK